MSQCNGGLALIGIALTLQAIVTFALSLVDALLFVHYAAVLLLEVRQLPPRYYVHVIRSPDGVSRGYPIGAVSLPFVCGRVPSGIALPPRRRKSRLSRYSRSV